MCLSFHIKVVRLCGMPKKKSIYKKHLCLLSLEIFPPGLPNLGSKIRCAQNWYTAVQIIKVPPASGYLDIIQLFCTAKELIGFFMNWHLA